MKNKISKTIRKLLRSKRGMTGLETAIILISFVIVAAAFAFTVLQMGMQTSQKGKEVMGTGLAEASSCLELDGSVIAYKNETGEVVAKIVFYVKTAAGKQPVDMSNETLSIAYTDPYVHLDNIFGPGRGANVTQVLGDDDTMLEYGEKFKIEIDFATMFNATGVDSTKWKLTANDRFTIEVKPNVGAVLTVSRYVPPALDDVMDLG